MLSRKILTVFMSLILVLNLATPIYGEGEVSVDDVDKAMQTVSNSVNSLGDIADADKTSLASIFTSFLDIARNTGYVFSAINGSVTFLKLIGVVTDQTQSSLNSILTQLTIMNDRLASMEAQLNEITTRMAQIQASQEFNARTAQANDNKKIWLDFEYRYMENSLGKLMNTYDSVLKAGLADWCSGSRSGTYYGVNLTNSSSGADFTNVLSNSSFYAIYGSASGANQNISQSTSGVGRNINYDNSYVTLLYKKIDDDYKIIYSDKTDPTTVLEETDRWLTIPSSCLPQSISYNVNTFNSDLKTAIFNLVKAEVQQENISIFDAHNFDLFTQEGKSRITDTDISKIAEDAVNTLVYKTASLIVNGDSTFAGNVRNEFNLYCSHLQAGGEGIDAVLKTFFLTHAFEYETKDDINNFLDRMTIITGTYGMFAANILGMSDLITDNEKMMALKQMSDAINTIKEAKTNSLTGNDRYCYITGSNLAYTTVEFSSSADITAHYTLSNTTYKSYKGVKPTAYYDYSTYDSTPIGDVAMILIVNTLLSNNITPDHAYLSEKIGRKSPDNYGLIVTGFSPSQNFTVNGSFKQHVKNAFGSYFKNDSTITSLPDDADLDDVVYHQKITGSLYNLSNRTLSSNETLCALAVYGENHWYWTTDEGAFMGGPSTNSKFRDSYSVKETGRDSTGVIKTHHYTMDTAYNVILSIPIIRLNDSLGTYDPLSSYEKAVTTYKYVPSLYEETRSGINSSKTNINVDGYNLSTSFNQGRSYDCVIDIDDTYLETIKAELQDENGNKLCDCLVESGSIKVTIPSSFLDNLRGGTYNYKLCIFDGNQYKYSYDIQFLVHGRSSYNIVNTAVR